MKWMIREKEMTMKNLREEMKYIWNDLARNETHFIMFSLSFSFHNNTRQCPKSCAGTCLYFIIKVVDTSAPNHHVQMAMRAPQHQAQTATRALHHHVPMANEAPYHHWQMAMRAFTTSHEWRRRPHTTSHEGLSTPCPLSPFLAYKLY